MDDGTESGVASFLIPKSFHIEDSKLQNQMQEIPFIKGLSTIP
jgi:hypothetical protein